MSPQFAPGTGPRVLVDAAHGNFHTIDGRFAAFGELLRADGYRVAGAGEAVTPELSAQTAVNGDKVVRMGMNDPEAPQNAQFVLNVLHWPSGLLPD
jgi:hypothetical protein